MEVLNLYAGIGGNRKLWTDVEVTAVELNPEIAAIYKDFFPNDNVVVADAHQYLLDHFKEFDFIWSSPPCQSHTKMMKATRYEIRRYPDMALYQEIIWLQHFFKGLWVVENVKPYYNFLINPDIILGRHCFWGNFKITPFSIDNYKSFITADSPADIQGLKEWLGLEYTGNIYYDGNHSPGQVLRNCVHPKTGLHILNCAMNKEKVTQKTIFDI